MFHSFPFSYLEEAISGSLNIPSTGYLFQGQAGRISQEIRIRPTCREIESLQAQIREGRYQPDPQEIAARMLLQKEAD